MLRWFVCVLCACTNPAPAPQLGDVMTKVGRRFELLGRAAQAKRWELAEFELGKLRETFDDLPKAEIPADVHADIPQLVKVLVPTVEKTLQAGLATHDVATAFAGASQSCNACHQEAGRRFIEVPDKLGETVPRLDPLP